MSRISNWWNRHKIKEQALQQELNDLQTNIQTQLGSIQDQLNEYKKTEETLRSQLDNYKQKEKEEQALQQELNDLQTQLGYIQDQLNEYKKTEETLHSQLDNYKQKEKEDQDRKNSNVPWVELKGDDIDLNKGISLQLDWNDAFIEYLKENGITGKSEDAIVQKWLALLYIDLTNKFEDRIVDNSDNQPNEFE